MSEKEAAEGSASPSNSPQAGAQSGSKAAKDKNCPFCGQAFTSSSLGRHLDLYVKPKNPKPPDGVHDVDAIRQLRGSITRRQPRGSTKAPSGNKDDEERSPAWPRSDSQPRRSGVARLMDETAEDSPGNSRSRIAANGKDSPSLSSYGKWTATGVINDLPARRTDDDPPSGQALRLQEMRRNTSGQRVQRPDYEAEQNFKAQEQAEIGRAAELALREILGSLEAAVNKAHPTQLFDHFDFYALSFPALVLAILPPPATLFSPTPFPGAATWFLDPPSRKEFESIHRAMSEQVLTLRNGVTERFPDSAIFRLYTHLETAYEHWGKMSQPEQADLWKLEIMRAFAREREHSQRFKTDLDAAQQRIRHLEADYDRLARCQLPRDYLLHPPNTLPVTATAMKEMQTSEWKSGAAEASYDPDVLINRWKAIARSTQRSTTKPSSDYNQSKPSHQSVYYESRKNELEGDIVLNGSVFGVNGPMSRDMNHVPIGPPQVSYQTPPQPGAVVDTDEDGVPPANPNTTARQDRAAQDQYSHPDAGGTQTALARFRPESDPSWNAVSAEINANGKRPHAPTPPNGGPSGLKVYKEIPK